MSSQMRLTTQESTRVSYFLLRVWRVPEQGGTTLRASLQSRLNGGWVGFASLEALVAALRSEVEREPGPVADE